VFRNEIVRSWRVGLAWLRQATGQPARLTPWGWAADASLALVLMIAAVAGYGQDEPAPVFVAPQIRGRRRLRARSAVRATVRPL
jgi:hypothetical protein